MHSQPTDSTPLPFRAALFALLYGDYHSLHRRLLESLRPFPDLRITLWCNQVCPATLDLLKHTRYTVRRRQAKLLDPAVQITEHQALAGRCPACGGVTRGQIPASILASVCGPRLSAALGYLSAHHSHCWLVRLSLAAGPLTTIPSSIAVSRHPVPMAADWLMHCLSCCYSLTLDGTRASGYTVPICRFQPVRRSESGSKWVANPWNWR